MVLIDSILNLAGLLLWLSWRSDRSDAALAGTSGRAEPLRLQRWHFLAALIGLLIARALLYRVIGPELSWTPRLDFVVVALAFRDDIFVQVCLFSALSFFRTLVVFYFWLLFLAVLNRSVRDVDPVQKAIQLQLGRIGRWPALVQLVLPLLATAVLWIALHPLLARVGIVSPVRSMNPLLGQSVWIGVLVYFSLKYLLPAILLVHVVSSYVYLGNSPLWDFVGLTARNLLAPLRRVSMRFGRVDFAPLAGILLLVLLLHLLPSVVLEVLTRELDRRNLDLWPQ